MEEELVYKQELIVKLEEHVNKNESEKAIKLWADSDVELSYENEVDYELGKLITKAYIALNDLKSAKFYSKYQINFLINSAPSRVKDEMHIYLNCLINFYTAEGEPLKVARVVLAASDYGVELMAGYDVQSVIKKLERSKQFTRVYWIGATLLALAYAVVIYAGYNDIKLPEWYSWVINIIFYPYIAYMIVAPFRRWLIKGWIKQFVKIY